LFSKIWRRQKNKEVCMKKGILFALVFLTTTAYAWTLKTGTYDLSGGNTSYGGGAYYGELVIAPQGENYSVIWRTGSRQTQVGIGILQDDILSVAFTDVSNNQFWGVASYRVRPFGELEGRWTAADGQTQKPEYLIWKSYATY
jgi:hypothetical protein